MKRVLLLSPYDAMSHRYWREGLVAHLPEVSFTVVTLPARYFSWRHRGNSLSLARDTRLDDDFDLIVATSMTDLSALKGMLPVLSSVPAVLYFHENQFAYPESASAQGTVERQITSLYSAVAADRLIFNSEYNRQSFLGGAQSLLSRMPDAVPRGVVERLEEKSMVMAVPIEVPEVTGPGEGRFSIVWNHRWEFDKGPDNLEIVLQALLDRGIDFVCHLIGQQFRSHPEEMTRCVALLARHGSLGACGYVEDRSHYFRLLADSHVVLSTARHEFYGLSVLEAVASGCVPVLPNRLVYPELFDETYLYDENSEAVDLLMALNASPMTVPDLSGLSWESQENKWRNLIREMTDG